MEFVHFVKEQGVPVPAPVTEKAPVLLVIYEPAAEKEQGCKSMTNLPAAEKAPEAARSLRPLRVDDMDLQGSIV